MNDQWIDQRTSLDREYGTAGRLLQGAGGESVDGLGWNGNEPSIAQAAGQKRNISRGCRQDPCASGWGGAHL